jgi:RNA polymerase sigma-70 factor (ECF subfamily)
MGDTSDFSAWYREQHPLVLAALTVASGRADVAAEATDEAFVRAYERWERVRRMGSPGGWLYRVALNDLRRRCRRQAIERDLLRRQAPPPVAPAAVEPHLWEAVRALPHRQRTAVALRYVLDLPEADVARLMGVTRGSASATLTAARRRLESLLADARPAPPLAPAPAPAAATPPASAAAGTGRPGRLGTVAVRRG